MPSDIAFITNEPGMTLRERFAALPGFETQQFDCLAGHFFFGGVYTYLPATTSSATGPVISRCGVETDREGKWREPRD